MPLVGPDGVTPVSAPSNVPPVQDAPSAPQEVVTAFVVFNLPDGRWGVTDDLNAPLVPSRAPGPDDLIAGASNVQAEMTARKAADMAAQTTIQTQLAMARQAASQQIRPDEAAVLSKLGTPGGRR